MEDIHSNSSKPSLEEVSNKPFINEKEPRDSSEGSPSSSSKSTSTHTSNGNGPGPGPSVTTISEDTDLEHHHEEALPAQQHLRSNPQDLMHIGSWTMAEGSLDIVQSGDMLFPLRTSESDNSPNAM